MLNEIEIISLAAREDQRGRAYSIPQAGIDFLDGIIADTHLAEIKPGSVRGNHWHNNRWEVLLFNCSDSCTFAWADSPEGHPQTRDFAAGDCIAVLLPPFTPHAIKNTGSDVLWITSMANSRYDGQTQDTFPVELL